MRKITLVGIAAVLYWLFRKPASAQPIVWTVDAQAYDKNLGAYGRLN